MLNKIWDKLMSESTDNQTLMDKCIKMLQVVEREGMLPPRTKLDKLGLEDNAWDPEDNNEQRN